MQLSSVCSHQIQRWSYYLYYFFTFVGYGSVACLLGLKSNSCGFEPAEQTDSFIQSEHYVGLCKVTTPCPTPVEKTSVCRKCMQSLGNMQFQREATCSGVTTAEAPWDKHSLGAPPEAKIGGNKTCRDDTKHWILKKIQIQWSARNRIDYFARRLPAKGR